MRTAWRLWLTAVMFYTRIPVPHWVDHSSEYLNRATRFLPLVGWLVGAAAAGVYAAAMWRLPPAVAVLLAVAAAVWLTGAFHEDGFADTCDGFGGGWTPEQVLEIMKDSRVGTYGAIGLLLLLGIKVAALAALPVVPAVLALLVGHSLSRLPPVWMIGALPYARLDASSKVKPVAQGIGWTERLLAACFGLLPLVAIVVWTREWVLLALLPLVALATAYLARMFRRRIGGYTGDCLGATQQVCEALVYLGFCAAWG